jgi:uncharacterized protein (DUF58 family)
MLEARRVSAAVHGIHGRRRAGPGESFWQFRPYTIGEAANRIDWRRSGRDDKLYVRQREWEAAQSVWLWVDRSASMGYISSLARASKVERAIVIGFALAEALVEAGERVGHLDILPPRGDAAHRRGPGRGDHRRYRGACRRQPAAAPCRPSTRRWSSAISRCPKRICSAASRFGGGAARAAIWSSSSIPWRDVPVRRPAELADLELGLRLRVGDAAAWGEDYRKRIAAHRGAIVVIAGPAAGS